MRVFDYISFLWKSKNAHGVHSPFVYAYLTQGIYAQKRLARGRSMDWLMRSLKYFRPQRVFVCDEVFVDVGALGAESVGDANLADLVVFSTMQSRKVLFEGIDMLTTHQIILLMVEVYDVDFLDELRAREDITLVVDFYFGVLISKRLEQPKQNFFLRM